MELDFILNLIEENGYIGLFLWLWIGVFGIPIPNEIISMTIGLAASMKVLNPIVMFIVTYLGILAALTTSYLIGKYIGRPLLPFFEKRKRSATVIEKSLRIMDKYHAYSLTFSYFIPGMRNFVPFLYGLSKLPFKTFIIFAYTGAAIWLTIFFSLGYWFGDHKETIVEYEKEILLIAGAVLMCFLALKVVRRKKKEKVKAL